MSFGPLAPAMSIPFAVGSCRPLAVRTNAAYLNGPCLPAQGHRVVGDLHARGVYPVTAQERAPAEGKGGGVYPVTAPYSVHPVTAVRPLFCISP